jgi:hypothetical protein
MQPALIMASIKYRDNLDTVNKKIKIVSKYLTKVLSWRVWNHWVISQSSLESKIYDLCKTIRGKDIEELEKIVKEDPLKSPELKGIPTLNQQNKKRIKVLLSLITEIIASNSEESNYLLDKKDMEIEHIWADHFEQHSDECKDEAEFSMIRNQIGDLLVLPKSFNSSYGDEKFANKVVHYIQQNILAQTLNKNKYTNNPGFLKFKENSKIPFKSYDNFTKDSIMERTNLYKEILLWNWR